MSDPITIDQFEEQVKPITEEATKLNERLSELHRAFIQLANKVEFDDDDDDEIRDTFFEAAAHFIDNIDYEYSEISQGDVKIWQQSTC